MPLCGSSLTSVCPLKSPQIPSTTIVITSIAPNYNYYFFAGSTSFTTQNELSHQHELTIKLDSFKLTDIPTESPLKLNRRKYHLIVSLEVLDGSKDLVNACKQVSFDLQTMMYHEYNQRCRCDVKTPHHNNNTVCEGLISAYITHAEQTMANSLKSKLKDAESYICAQTGTIVEIIEGCIKIKVRVHDSYHFNILEEDIKSGKFIKRIKKWVENEGIDLHGQTHALVLTVDVEEILQLRDELSKEANKMVQGKILCIING